MDTLQIFPALLALMIATLAALGYALQRLEQSPKQRSTLSLLTRRCSQCGQHLAVDWRHCPECGLLMQPLIPFPGKAHQGHPHSAVPGAVQDRS